jgi:hypothetical protein
MRQRRRILAPPVLTTTVASPRPRDADPPRTGRGHATRCLLALAVVVLSGGCIGATPECAALPTDIELTLTAESLIPSDPAVCRDADVMLTVRSDIDGVLHVHGYDDQVSATPVTDGRDVVIEFTASRSGQFPIELHTDENAQGVNVGLLTVHEP